MFDRAEEFHRRADECRKQAAKNADREEWLKIAEAWLRMAEDSVQLSGEPDPAFRSDGASASEASSSPEGRVRERTSGSNGSRHPGVTRSATLFYWMAATCSRRY